MTYEAEGGWAPEVSPTLATEAFLQQNPKDATLCRLRPAVSGLSAALPIQAQ